MAHAIVVSELTKSYGDVQALRGVSFDVAEGEVFGLLGPNGAGKTTTVEILEGYRGRDGGGATVLGFDPGEAPRGLRERMGVVLQQSELSPLLTVRETHRLFAGYFANPRDVDEVIELVGLGEKRDARVKSLSGGQKRRLDLGVALVGNPELVFLDEPTTGFDPAARRAAWELIRSLRSLGTTILLTTHYLDEAQQLADRVAVLRDGVIVRQGSPADLIGDIQTTEIRYLRDGERVVVTTTEPTRVLNELTADALAAGRDARADRGSSAEPRGRLPRARGRGAGVSMLAHQLRFEQKTFWRSREAAVFIFVFPLLLYALLGSVYGDDIDFEGVPAAVDVLLAGLFGYGAANTAFGGLAIVLVVRREAGVLKRIRATPLAPGVYLTAVLLSTLVTFALQSVGLLGARRPRLRREHAGELARLRRRRRAGSRVVRRDGARRGISHQVGRGRLGGRQRRHPPDGVPVRVLRADPGLPGFPAGDRGRPPAHVLHRRRERRLPGRRLAVRRPEGSRVAVLAWGAAGVLVALRRFGWMPRER